MKYPDLSSAQRSVLHTEEWSAPNHPEYLAFSDNSSDSDKDHGEQEGGNVECDPKLKQVVPHPTTIY